MTISLHLSSSSHNLNKNFVTRVTELRSNRNETPVQHRKTPRHQSIGELNMLLPIIIVT